MLKAYTPATYRTVIEYELAFDDGLNNGFGFPCDRDGKLLESEDQNPEAHENLKFCLAHPEKFDRFNEVVEYRRRIREDARGICSWEKIWSCGTNTTGPASARTADDGTTCSGRSFFRRIAGKKTRQKKNIARSGNFICFA